MIEQLILNDPTALQAAQDSDWQACADRLNQIAEPTANTSLRGSGWLMSAMPNDAEAILGGIKQALQASADPQSLLHAAQNRIERVSTLLDTSGIDWSVATFQTLLPLVAQTAGWDAELLARVQAIGLVPASYTADQVQQAWQAYQANQAYEAIRGLRDRWDTLSQTIRSQIESGNLAESEVVAAVTAGWNV